LKWQRRGGASQRLRPSAKRSSRERGPFSRSGACGDVLVAPPSLCDATGVPQPSLNAAPVTSVTVCSVGTAQANRADVIHHAPGVPKSMRADTGIYRGATSRGNMAHLAKDDDGPRRCRLPQTVLACVVK
jgi:hypothetical protein